MLRNVPYTISPMLLKAMCEMGHGSELVLADANFPAVDCVPDERIVRSESLKLPAALADVLKLFPLDTTTDNVVLMRADEGDPEPAIWTKYREVLTGYPAACISSIDRFEFYERIKNAHCVLVTGERSPYANIILKKGTIHD